MKARIFMLSVMLYFCAAFATAGDLSNFVNLGFSADSKTFMFGLYGVREKGSIPYAEAYIVDVAGNRFVPGGQLVLNGTSAVTLGQDGSGALYNILHSIEPQIRKYKIDHLKLGRLVYVLFNGQEPKQEIAFHDFDTGNVYDVAIVQSSRPLGDGKTVTVPGASASPTSDPSVQTFPKSEAEFSIRILATLKDGSTKSVLVGKPGFFRSPVNVYVIRQIVLSPDEKSLILIVEKQDRSGKDLSTNFMVETIRIF